MATEYFENLCTNTTGCSNESNTNGLIKVTHDTTENENFTAVEYRYRGSNPDNYVTFNGEEAGWRIVGIFDGRVKLVRKIQLENMYGIVVQQV